MLISYHNHTTWSDGAQTLAEMIAGARAAGVEELGISDHLVLAPDGAPVSWSMPPDFLGEYVAWLQAAKVETSGLTLRLGIEADFFPETVAETRARLERYPFDYVIGSVHFVDGFPVDEDAAHWEALSEIARNDVWRGYWRRVRQMAESGAFDIAAHLDLPKKFGFLPTIDLTAEVTAALDALATHNMALEINTAGWHKPIAEAYPTLAILQEAHRRNIPLLINADAHRADHLTTDFARACTLAHQAGYTTQVGYACRHAFTCGL